MSLFRKRVDPDARWIVVGLGNPGDRYSQTRHNAGAMVLDVLAQRVGAKLKSHRSGCLVAEGLLSGEKVTLARPTSYMNRSGLPVARLLAFYKLEPDRLIVLHDELDIAFGEVRVKSGGGTAGHNGLGSLASALGTKDFVRVRIGIGRPPGDAAAYVLGRFGAAERKELPDLLERAADTVEAIVDQGVERTMTDVNSRRGSS